MRLFERLQEYNFKIAYLPGVQNYIQDALSRRPYYQCNQLLVLPNLTQPASPIIEHCPKSSHEDHENSHILDVDMSGNIFTAMTVNADEWLDEVQDAYRKDSYFAEVLAALESKHARDNTLAAKE